MQNQFGLLPEVVITDPLFWSILPGILILSVLASGLLPSLFVNRVHTLDLFRLKYKVLSGGLSLRQAMVVAQFIIIIGIVAGIIGMSKQVDYLIQKDKGFDVENTIVVKVPQNLRKTSQRVNNLNAFENDLLFHSSILGVSSSNSVPGDVGASNFSFGSSGSDKMRKAVVIITDKNYIDNYKINLLAGDDFRSSSSGGEREGCIINKACFIIPGIHESG